jgi:hypothetical protein
VRAAPIAEPLRIYPPKAIEIQHLQVRSHLRRENVNSREFIETEPIPEPIPMRSRWFRPAAPFVAAIALVLASCDSATTEPDPASELDPPIGSGLRTRMYAHNGAGDLATIDMTTGVVTFVGNMVIQMLDIRFDHDARLFAISSAHLFRIDTLTGTRTVLGEFTGHALESPKALAGSADGTLYAAGYANTLLHTVDPNTGASTLVGDMGHSALGDLAFHNGWLYMVSSVDLLIKVDRSNPQNSVVVGPLGVTGVFGLATGPDGNLYGSSGTSIYRIDPATGAATNPIALTGYTLGNVWGLACRCGP